MTAHRQDTVSAQITGTLTEVFIGEGEHVQVGQALHGSTALRKGGACLSTRTVEGVAGAARAMRSAAAQERRELQRKRSNGFGCKEL